jgi:hypothetical protein
VWSTLKPQPRLDLYTGFYPRKQLLTIVQHPAPHRTNIQPLVWFRAGAIHSLLRHPEQLAAERAQHAGKRQALGLNPASPLAFGGGAGYGSPGGFFHGVKVHAYVIGVGFGIRVWHNANWGRVWPVWRLLPRRQGACICNRRVWGLGYGSVQIRGNVRLHSIGLPVSHIILCCHKFIVS